MTILLPHASTPGVVQPPLQQVKQRRHVADHDEAPGWQRSRGAAVAVIPPAPQTGACGTLYHLHASQMDWLRLFVVATRSSDVVIGVAA